jgi:hypothetical protein
MLGDGGGTLLAQQTEQTGIRIGTPKSQEKDPLSWKDILNKGQQQSPPGSQQSDPNDAIFRSTPIRWTITNLRSPSAEAAEVGPCNDLDRISILVGQTKSYSEGKITIAHVDTEEPACCSSHLLVIISRPGLFGRECFAVSLKAAQNSEGHQVGFLSIEFNRIKASYDLHRGLLLNVPYALYNLDDGGETPGSTNVRVDLRDEGSVRIER